MPVVSPCAQIINLGERRQARLVQNGKTCATCLHHLTPIDPSEPGLCTGAIVEVQPGSVGGPGDPGFIAIERPLPLPEPWPFVPASYGCGWWEPNDYPDDDET